MGAKNPEVLETSGFFAAVSFLVPQCGCGGRIRANDLRVMSCRRFFSQLLAACEKSRYFKAFSVFPFHSLPYFLTIWRTLVRQMCAKSTYCFPLSSSFFTSLSKSDVMRCVLLNRSYSAAAFSNAACFVTRPLSGRIS